MDLKIERLTEERDALLKENVSLRLQAEMLRGEASHLREHLTNAQIERAHLRQELEKMNERRLKLKGELLEREREIRELTT